MLCEHPTREEKDVDVDQTEDETGWRNQETIKTQVATSAGPWTNSPNKNTPVLRGVSFNSFPVFQTMLSAVCFDRHIPDRLQRAVPVQGV